MKFSDLKGTLGNVFSIGRKANIDASGLTSQRDISIQDRAGEIALTVPPVIAVAEEATSNDPGGDDAKGYQAWSSTLNRPVMWTGSYWTEILLQNPPALFSGSVSEINYAETSGSAGTFGFTISLATTTVAGQSIAVHVRSAVDSNDPETQLTPTITDNLGNTYTATSSWLVINGGDQNAFERLFYSLDVGAGVNLLTVTWPVGQFGDYRSACAVTLTGVSAYQGLAQQIVNTTGAGTDNVSSGTYSLTSAPALLVGFCVNEREFSSPIAPDAGTGWTSHGTWMNFSLGFGDFGRVTSKLATATGSQEAVFSTHGADTFYAHVMAFT